MNNLSQQYGHLPTTSKLKRSLVGAPDNKNKQRRWMRVKILRYKNEQNKILNSSVALRDCKTQTPYTFIQNLLTTRILLLLYFSGKE